MEIFLATATTEQPFPYFELKLNPIGQTYQAMAQALKKPFQEGVDLATQSSVDHSTDVWTEKIRILLSELGWDKNPATIKGNAFARLGKRPLRSYWSLILCAEGKPKLHQPEYFRPLLNSYLEVPKNQ